MSEPNWDSVNSTTGYCPLAEIPQPHVRLFPNPIGRKRIVRLGIMRYYGIGKHYYAHAEEEHNAIWHSERNSWWSPHDDKEGAGRQFNSPEGKSVYYARDWLRRTLEANFPTETHEYIWQDYTCPQNDDPGHPRWFYKEGD